MPNISSDAQTILNNAGPGAFDYIMAHGGYAGNVLTSGEAQRALQGFAPGATPGATPASGVPSLNQLASQQFQFDPNQYLPGIQATAASIYNPQQAQLQALSALQTSQTEQARIRTNEDFAKRLEAEKESINARGAFFGGGALNRESNIGQQQTFALNDINFQDQAAQAGLLAQQAGLSAAAAQYIQEQLSGASNSAYARFQDQRNFMLGLTQEQRRIFESDREFNEDVRQFGLNYALDKKAAKNKDKDKNTGTISQFTAGGQIYTINNATGQITQAGIANPRSSGSGSRININEL